jgi:RHS repeat-associated protein
VGNLQNFTYPNGVASAYTYDALNRLTQMGSSKSATSISNYAYTLGAAGNRLTVAELSGRTVNYGYDSLYRLTSEAVTSDPNNHDGSTSYQYDNVGNRKQLLVNGTTANAYTYDADDRLGSDQYDADGNTISSGGTSNTYDFENHMVQDGYVTLVYDGDGNRVSETVGSVTTNYLMDTQNPTGYAQVVDELQSGAVTRTYSYGLERISENQTLNSTWTLSFYGYDGHGSVRQLTSSTGAVTDTYDYDAFGNLINQTGSTPNNYLFAGEQYDPALSLYYNRARYLNTGTGRFWSMDTYEGDGLSPLSIHKYLYASANPVDRIDPSGHQDTAEELSGEADGAIVDSAADEESYTAQKVLNAPVVDIYSCSRLQAYIIPIHCWVYANEPGNEGVRYDIGAGDRGPGLILGSVSGYLEITPTTLSAVQTDANLSFVKQVSLSELGFLQWQAVIVAEFEFISFTEQAITYSTNYSFNTLTNDAVNCITFTGAAIAAAKQIAATE